MEKANVYNDSRFNFTSSQNFGMSRTVSFKKTILFSCIYNKFLPSKV